jgi:hypothetical protein
MQLHHLREREGGRERERERERELDASLHTCGICRVFLIKSMEQCHRR